MKSIILGLGISGQAAAEWLIGQGHVVVGCDRQVGKRSFAELEQLGVSVRGDEEGLCWDGVDQLVVSPGISLEHPLYVEAVRRGVRIVSEVELALAHFKGPLLAVTGTNGKTTVTLLATHLLNCAGVRAVALGNVGVPLCRHVAEQKENEVGVVELSSFQLETLRGPFFDGAVLLNITPDHLDRHKTMECYASLKCRLQECLKEGAPLWVGEDVQREWGHLLREGVNTFSSEGGHDRANVQAASLLVTPFCVPQGFETFRKPPHRIEFIRKVGGVSYFDDSKGTNLDAVVQAVKTMKGPVILIAGGVDKGASYLFWKEPFLGKVKKIITFGQAGPKIAEELRSHFEIKEVDGLSSAVRVAAQTAAVGDCVLLSPGCASYDLFRDYAHRGEMFQQDVHAILGDEL